MKITQLSHFFGEKISSWVKNGQIKICTSCVEARGLKDLKFIEGACLNNMKELTTLLMESDKVVTF